mgnify:CR=1 FL=1
MSPDKLVYMANQIGKFFAHEGEELAAQSVATHLRRYWDPRMRTTILAHLDAGGAGLDPVVRRAVVSLKEEVSRS